MPDVEEERREDAVPLRARAEDPLSDVPAAARLGARIPRGPPLHGEERDDGERRHPDGAGGRHDGERGLLRSEVRHQARLQRCEPADRSHREDRERDDGGHLDDELHEVGPEDGPHPRRGGVQDRDREADPDGGVGLHAERDLEDLHHRERHPAEDDQVDRERQVERAHRAQERGRRASVTKLRELHVRHHVRAPPEARVEEDCERPRHHHVPPEPVPRDAVRRDEPRDDERRVGRERRRDHRGARQPPRDPPPRDEVLLERLAALLRELQPDADRDEEVHGDDRAVEDGERHGRSVYRR